MDRWPNSSWVSRCDTALKRHDVHGGPLCVAHQITDTDGSFDYFVEVTPVGARAVAGTPDRPLVTFTQNYATAAKIRSGDLTPGEAILLGEVAVLGHAETLVEHQALLAALASIIADTE